MISPESLIARPTRRVESTRHHPLVESSMDGRIVRQFRRVADAILKEFSNVTEGTILFSGVGSSKHVADVATHVARQLSRELNTSVTLVDGDADAQSLTERLGWGDALGLAEVLQQLTPMAATLVATDVDGVRFMPCGDRRLMRNPISSDAVKAVISNLHQLCRYTIIAAGTEASCLHAMLSRHSDGTYLVVQLGAARRQDTSDLADYLTRAGARLLGCVATSSV